MDTEGGNTRRLSEAQQSLVSDPRHLRLASKVVARFSKRFAPLSDEFESASYVALCEAAITYDESIGLPFSAHASSRLVGAMRDVCRFWTACGFRRSHKDAPSVSSLAAIIGESNSGRTLSLGETIAADDEPVGWEAESIDEIRGLSRRLPGRAGEVIRLMYGHADSLTGKDVALATGLSESRVSQMHTLAIEELLHRFPDPQEIFMSGPALAYSEPRPTESPVSLDKPKPPSAATEAPGGNGACPVCQTPYGKRRRCYRCAPGLPVDAGERPVGRPRTIKMEPEAAPVPMPSPARKSDARAELQAMDEILAIVERLDPEAARRALNWVSERIQGAAS